MANDPRQLRHGEQRMSFFTSEKGRDRAAAQRAIAGLSQQDQIIALLGEQNQLLSEQNQMMKYLCDSAHFMMTRSQPGTSPDGSAGPASV